jgi:hypothetical protein
MNALPLVDAACELEASESTLRRWIAEGAPVARRGSRGRGRRMLIDPEAVRAWRRQGDDARSDFVRVLASELPELLGNACADAYRIAPDKRNGAWIAVAGWQMVIGAITDRLRADDPDLPEINVIPESIERLRKIADK